MVHALAGCGFARCYVISEEEGLVVVDVGSVGTAEDVARFISRDLCRAPEQIRYIIATHFHIDHIGGIGHLLEKSGESTRVVFHQRVNDYLSGAKYVSGQKKWTSGLCPAVFLSARYVRKYGHFRFESLAGIPLPGFRKLVNLPYPTEKIKYLNDSNAIRQSLGFGRWDVIKTPGHTEDSISLNHESSAELICGDLILNFKKNGSGYLHRFCSDEDALLKAYRDLCHCIEPQRIYPGHGEIISGNGNVLLNVRTFH